MPYLDVALRQALNLVESCPSDEAVAAAAAARGLQLRDGQLLPIPAAKKPAPKAPAAGGQGR